MYGTEGSVRIFHYANALFPFTASDTSQIPLTGRPSPHHFGTQIDACAMSLIGSEPAPVDADGIRALATVLGAYKSDAVGRNKISEK